MKHTPISRRDFLKNLGIAGAGTLLAASPWLSAFSEVTNTSNEKCRLAIIGPGSRGRFLMGFLAKNPKVEIVALCDIYKPSIESALELVPNAKVYGDYREVLEDKSIDAILVATPLSSHCKIVLDAFDAGKHVFCEKPIDHDVAKIKEVIDALKDSNVKYQVGFNRRFDHNFEAVQKAVADGKIGDTHIIKITSRDPEPPCADYVKVSGGIFLDMTIHDFDMVRFLAGCNATEVYVEAAVLVDPAIGEAGDVDTAVITLKMENGAIAVIDNSRKAAYGYDQRAEVFGSKGMVAVSNDSTSSAVISNADGVTGEKPLYFFLERYMAAYAKEIKCFIEAIENDTDTPLGVMDGLQPVLMGLAAKKSLEEHRPVKISEITV